VTSEDQLDLALMERIRTAWGNTGWSADAGFLVEVGKRVWRNPGPVLDCGSGVSTLVLAVLAARHGATVWSLEQERTWYEEMQRQLIALHLHNVVLWHAPLSPYGDYLWFDLTSRELPPHFPTVACDGPAVRLSAGTPEEFAAWRSGVVPVLCDRGVTFDEIVLDDFEDMRCAALIERWNRAGITTSVVVSPTGTVVVGRPSEPVPRGVP
jgi:hypothetical protein